MAHALDRETLNKVLNKGLAKIAKVGVVGSGTMATGIIEVFAKAG